MTTLIGLSLVLLAQETSPVAALFDATTKDFGSVPQGSISVHHFRVKNTLREPLRINNLRSSCRCAISSASTFEAKPGETLIIEVKYDTRSFAGARSMTVTVAFEQPVVETVVLKITGFSRQDVVFNPGEILFGVVPRGYSGAQKARIEYAGNLDWRIVELVPPRYFDASFAPLEQATGRIGYEVTLALKKEAPPGPIAEVVMFRTNDPQTPQLQLLALATIQAPLTAAPETLDFGQMKVGAKVVKRLLLRASQPFAIRAVRDAGDEIVLRASDGMRTSQIVDVEYTPRQAGKVQREFTIRTSLEVDNLARVRIVAEVE